MSWLYSVLLMAKLTYLAALNCEMQCFMYSVDTTYAYDSVSTIIV